MAGFETKLLGNSNIAHDTNFDANLVNSKHSIFNFVICFYLNEKMYICPVLGD